MNIDNKPLTESERMKWLADHDQEDTQDEKQGTRLHEYVFSVPAVVRMRVIADSENSARNLLTDGLPVATVAAETGEQMILGDVTDYREDHLLLLSVDGADIIETQENDHAE